jgi:hypothetical protein
MKEYFLESLKLVQEDLGKAHMTNIKDEKYRLRAAYRDISGLLLSQVDAEKLINVLYRPNEEIEREWDDLVGSDASSQVQIKEQEKQGKGE